MSAVKTIDLGEHFGAFVEAQIESGIFEDADDVVRAGLALLEQASAARDARIRAAIAEGLGSGEPVPFDIDEFLGRMHRRISAEER